MAQGSTQRGLALVLDLASSPLACTSAAAAASAAVLYRQTAHCEFVDTFEGAQGEIFSLDAANSATWARSRSGVHGLDYTKQRHHQLKTVRSVYSPSNLAFTGLRSLLFNLLPIWHDYFQRVEAAEEEAFALGLEPLEVWPPFPREQVQPALYRSLWMSLRDLATLTVRRLYERVVALHCSPETAVKLLKDVRASAVRKSKNLPFYTSLHRVPRTYFRANLLGSAADFTVSLAIDSYRVIHVPARQGRPARGRKRALQRFGRLCAANAFRCSTCLVVSSVGAGVGAWLFSGVNRPGMGTFVGASAAEFGFTVFVVAPLVNDWAYGLHDGPPPPRVEDGAGRGVDAELPGGD